MRQREPIVVCVVCGYRITWRYARRGVLPFAQERVWLCQRCFFAYGCDQRSLGQDAGDEEAAAG